MKTFFAFVLAALLSSCATIAPPAPSGSVDHVVMFWQKNPVNAADRKKITDAMERLRVIEGITALDYGTAVKSERPVVDDSFDIALLVRFKMCRPSMPTRPIPATPRKSKKSCCHSPRKSRCMTSRVEAGNHQSFSSLMRRLRNL